MSTILAFAASKLGVAILAAVAVAIALAWLYLDAKAAGAATATAAAAAEAARRIQAANKARAEIDKSREAERNDPYNRRD
jgi:hypothetical protein